MGIITRFEQGNGYNTNFLRTFATEDITSRSPSIDGEVGSLTGMRDAGWAMLLSSPGMSALEPWELRERVK